MLAWMPYVIVVSLLLGLAAFALERSARVRQKPTRWLWGASMIASLLVPLVISSVSVQIPRLTGVDPAIPQQVAALRQMTASGLSPSGWLTATAGRFSASPDLERLLQVGWSVASTLLFLAILATSAQLHLRRRRWERGSMAGVPVFISRDSGPAIVGLLNPQIVVPTWLTECSPDVQELVIAHEQSHLEAHDVRLVTIAFGLLVCLPWNLPLWWQLRRLRFAVEIDCDARVLRRGYDVSRYGETLIAVGEKQSATIVTAAAMAESGSLLEQRIRNILRKKTKYAQATALALASLGIAFAVGAAEISPPNNDDPGKLAAQEGAMDSKAERLKSHSATPGSEAALLRLIAANLDYDEIRPPPDQVTAFIDARLPPALAGAPRQQLPELHRWLAQLGAVQSVQFLGGARGFDVYSVKHEYGATHWTIALGAKGTISIASVTAGP
jgi:bla regulator protein BlaR1